jgi:hypothetical protein
MKKAFGNSELGGGGPVICRGCRVLLTPGRGDFYVVVEAYAENLPMVISTGPSWRG